MAPLENMPDLPDSVQSAAPGATPDVFGGGVVDGRDHGEPRLSLSAPGLVVYRFFPSFAAEEQLNEVEECMFCLWEACGQLGMNQPVPGQPFSEYLPIIPGRLEGASGYGLTVIAARQSPRGRNSAVPTAGGRAVLFEQDDVRGLAVWLTAGLRAGPDGLAQLDSEEQVALGTVGGLVSGYEHGWLLGEARLFTGYARCDEVDIVMPIAEDAAALAGHRSRDMTSELSASRELMLPAGARVASAGGPHVSIGEGIVASGNWDGPVSLRCVALSTVASSDDLPRAEEELTRWAWQGSSGGLAPFASYALHASRLRREFNEYHGSRERAGERARLYLQRESANRELDRLLALHAGEMRYGGQDDLAAPRSARRSRSGAGGEEPPVELLIEGHQRLSGLLMRSGGLMSAAMKAREARQRVAQARRGMVEAVPEAVRAPTNSFLERDLAMAARLTSQIGADLAQAETAVAGSREVFSLTDLRVRQEVVKQERGRHTVSRLQGGIIVGLLGLAAAVIAFHLQLKAPAFIEWSIGACVVAVAMLAPSAFSRWMDGRRPSDLPGVTGRWRLPGDPAVSSDWGLAGRKTITSAVARSLAAGLAGAGAFWLVISVVWWQTKGLVRGFPSHEGLEVMGLAAFLGALLAIVITNPRVPRWDVRRRFRSELRRRRKARARRIAERELLEEWDIGAPGGEQRDMTGGPEEGDEEQAGEPLEESDVGGMQSVGVEIAEVEVEIETDAESEAGGEWAEPTDVTIDEPEGPEDAEPEPTDLVADLDDEPGEPAKPGEPDAEAGEARSRRDKGWRARRTREKLARERARTQLEMDDEEIDTELSTESEEPEPTGLAIEEPEPEAGPEWAEPTDVTIDEPTDLVADLDDEEPDVEPGEARSRRNEGWRSRRRSKLAHKRAQAQLAMDDEEIEDSQLAQPEDDEDTDAAPEPEAPEPAEPEPAGEQELVLEPRSRRQRRQRRSGGTGGARQRSPRQPGNQSSNDDLATDDG